MLRWMDFKPERTSPVIWLQAFFNYYLRFRLKRFIKTDSFSIVFKVKVDAMMVEKVDKIKNRISGLNREDYSIKPVHADSAADLYKIIYPWKRSEFDKYFKNGSECFVWKIEDEIKCFTWSSYGKIDSEVKKEFDLDVSIGANDIWGMDIVVHPSYRGRAFEYLIFKLTADSLRKRGVDNIFGSVYIGDRGSLKMHKRVGFKPEYLHHHKRRFGISKSMLFPINEQSIEIANKEAKKLGVDIGFLWS